MPADFEDPGRYGASFADVYDRWYPGGDESELCGFLATELGPEARVLELGVGTGRVALTLAAAGFEVVGLDASTEMLDALATKDPEGTLTAVRADAGDPRTWIDAGIDGPFDCVLAACNLLLNLTAPGAQPSCIAGSARLLAPGGILVTEVSRMEIPDNPAERVAESSVRSDAPVLIATHPATADPDTNGSGSGCARSTGSGGGSGLVEGRHIELLEGEPARVRPWSIRAIADGDLERWCATAGLQHRSTHAGWDRSPCRPDDAVTISVHERPAR